MWVLGIAAAVVAGAAAVWWVRHRLEQRLAAETDQRARDVLSVRAEVAQLRHGRRDDALVVQAATAVVDRAFKDMQ